MQNIKQWYGQKFSSGGQKKSAENLRVNNKGNIDKYHNYKMQIKVWVINEGSSSV